MIVAPRACHGRLDDRHPAAHRLGPASEGRFGLPPHQYLLQLRVDAARRLLAAKVPASEVAADVGFADQSHFVRRFLGVTPGRYVNVGAPR
jgi:AraC-like DNA-binding protein